MKSLNRNLSSLYATQDFLGWVKEVEPELHRWSIDNINHRPPVYMIEVEDQNCYGEALRKYYKQIIENELSNNLNIKKEKWPEDITYDLFSVWFTYQYHEEVYDLCEEDLEI